MAKIICITTGLTGILNASFELVERLVKDGHEVIYAAPRKVKERVELQKIEFRQLPEIPLDPGPALPPLKGPFVKGARLWYKIKNAAARKKSAVENINPIAFTKLLEAESPDLLIVDIELHEYIFRVHRMGIPFVLLSQWFSLWDQPGLPYLLQETIPGKGWKGSNWAIQINWLWIRWKRWWTFTRKKCYSVGTDRRSVLLDFAKKENFPLQYIRKNFWPGPFTYDHLPVISMTAWEMEFPHPIRPQLTYIGPMVKANRKELAPNKKTLDDLELIFQRRKKTKAALIYCSVSTLSKGDLNFIKKLLLAVKNKQDWILVIGMGGLLVEEVLGTLPENVFAFSYVPQLKILAEADCSINHGGIHTINECIFYKVPMLVYSGKKSDQNGCAARVHYHGLGLMADKDSDNAEEIQKNIHEVLTNSSFKREVEQMNIRFLKYKKDICLERVINGFLKDLVKNKL